MRTHPLNVTYLVVGLVFLGLAGSWALRESGLVVLDDAEWLLPLMLVAAGVVGLVAAAAKGLRRRNEDRYDEGRYDEGRYDDTEGDLR
jgi:hypothetical protein